MPQNSTATTPVSSEASAIKKVLSLDSTSVYALLNNYSQHVLSSECESLVINMNLLHFNFKKDINAVKQPINAPISNESIKIPKKSPKAWKKATDSPNTNAYKLTSTCKSWNIARIVSGSVGDINAPKYKVSKNVKLLLKYLGINFTQPYIIAPIKKADKVQPQGVLEASMNQNNGWQRPQLSLIK
uniref:Uncharacterized protein n=1 Tax=Glossina pallidipes TaxID=7398 RepID=A0A1A9Z425_GLOPL